MKKGRDRTTLHFLLVIALGILVYLPAFSASFHFDDRESILENIRLRSPVSPPALFSFWPTRFLLYLTFALDYRFWAHNPFGYHVVNAGVHILNSLLVLVLAERILAAAGAGRRTSPSAFLASLIFIAHPLQTQSVTYIVQRATCLASFFYLLALALYLKSVERVTCNVKRGAGSRPVQRDTERLRDSGLWVAGRRNQVADEAIQPAPPSCQHSDAITATVLPAKRSRVYRVCSLLSFACALFSKEMTVSLPLAVWMVDWICFPSDPKRWKRLVPFFLLALLVPVLVAFSTANPHYHDSGQIDFLLDAPVRDALSPGRGEYLVAQGRVMVDYLRLLVLPVRQNVDHDLSPAPPAVFAAGFCFCAALLILGLRLLARQSSIAGFAILWFFVVLFPESGIVPIKDLMAEHRLYLAVFGAALFPASLAAFRRRPPEGRSEEAGFAGTAAVVICLCLCLLTYRRNLAWKDDLTLWSDSAGKSPGKARPRHNLGLAWAERGEWEKAIREYRRSLELEPRFYKSHDNLGTALRQTGRIREAIASFREAIRLNPGYLPAYNNLAQAYLEIGERAAAGQALDGALALNPDHLQTAFNYALFLEETGDSGGSEERYRKILARHPGAWEARVNLAAVLLARGESAEAEAELREALRLNPSAAVAHYNLGNILAGRGEYRAAAACYREASRLKPDYAESWNNLGNALRRLGESGPSAEAYCRAIAAAPESPEAWGNLARLGKEEGRGDAERMVMEFSRGLPPASPVRRRLESLFPGKAAK